MDRDIGSLKWRRIRRTRRIRRIRKRFKEGHPQSSVKTRDVSGELTF